MRIPARHLKEFCCKILIFWQNAGPFTEVFSMSSVVLQANLDAVSQAFQSTKTAGQNVVSDLHQLVQDTVNALIDQGMRWGVNPVSAAMTMGSAALGVFSGMRGYHAFSDKVIGRCVGWGSLLGVAGTILSLSVPQTFRVGG